MNPLETTSIFWHFPVLIVTVSLIYSATRYELRSQILPEALHWGLRMTVFLASIAVALQVIPMLHGWGYILAGIGGIIAMAAYLYVTRPQTGQG